MTLFIDLAYNLSDKDGWCNLKVTSMAIECKPLVVDDLESDIDYHISSCR